MRVDTGRRRNVIKTNSSSSLKNYKEGDLQKNMAELGAGFCPSQSPVLLVGRNDMSTKTQEDHKYLDSNDENPAILNSVEVYVKWKAFITCITQS